MAATRLFTIEQCIAENIPLSVGYRDFEGYKGKFPDPQWPGNAKLCVNIVLNYEEGGEYRSVVKNPIKANLRLTQDFYSVVNGDMRSETDLQEVSLTAIKHTDST